MLCARVFVRACARVCASDGTHPLTAAMAHIVAARSPSPDWSSPVLPVAQTPCPSLAARLAVIDDLSSGLHGGALQCYCYCCGGGVICIVSACVRACVHVRVLARVLVRVRVPVGAGVGADVCVRVYVHARACVRACSVRACGVVGWVFKCVLT